MSNKIKGEITLDNGMVMVLDHNALATLEEVITDKGAYEILENLNKVSYIRAIYYACLKDNQPDITLREAGELMNDYPDALTQVLNAAFPDAAAQVAKGAANGGVAKKK